MSTPNSGSNWAMAVNIDQDALLARLEEEKNINYVEKFLKPNFPWLQLSEGKLFCKVRNMKGVVTKELYSNFIFRRFGMH